MGALVALRKCRFSSFHRAKDPMTVTLNRDHLPTPPPRVGTRPDPERFDDLPDLWGLPPGRTSPSSSAWLPADPGELVCLLHRQHQGRGQVLLTSASRLTSSLDGLWSPSCSVRSPGTTRSGSSTTCCAPTGRLGVSVRAVLIDNGPEYAGGFRAHLATKGLRHEHIRTRSPNNNAVCKRFHGLPSPTLYLHPLTPGRGRRMDYTSYNCRRRKHGD